PGTAGGLPPFRLERDYTFEVKIVPRCTEKPARFVLPVGRRFFHFQLNLGGDGGGRLVDTSEGQNERENSRSFSHDPFEVGQTYHLKVNVKIKESTAILTGEINDDEVIFWEGLITTLPADAGKHTPREEGRLAYGSQDCSYEFHEAKVIVGRGGGWRLRPGGE
ncbi:MAG: hypothetical protein AAF492_19340, partial [Verrucomicrobiota bacterium]